MVVLFKNQAVFGNSINSNLPTLCLPTMPLCYHPATGIFISGPESALYELDLSESGLKVVLPHTLTVLESPILSITSIISDLLKKLTSPGKIDGEDSKVIREIIAEGRRQQVDTIEFEIDREVAFGLNLQGLNDVDITLGAKGKTRYQVKVKYK